MEKSQPILSLSCYKPKSEADFDMGFSVPHVRIIVEILRVNIKLERDHELIGGGNPDILLAEEVDFFSKS